MDHDLSVNETLITKETNDAFTRPKKTALLLVNQNAGMGSAKEGEICYFVYADENYCAIWRSNDGWDGDAYQ